MISPNENEDSQLPYLSIIQPRSKASSPESLRPKIVFVEHSFIKKPIRVRSMILKLPNHFHSLSMGTIIKNISKKSRKISTIKSNNSFVGDKEELQLRATGTEFKPAFRLKPQKKKRPLGEKLRSASFHNYAKSVIKLPALNLTRNVEFTPVNKISRGSELTGWSLREI